MARDDKWVDVGMNDLYAFHPTLMWGWGASVIVQQCPKVVAPSSQGLAVMLGMSADLSGLDALPARAGC